MRGLKYKSYPERLKYLNIESLGNRRLTSDLVLYYKICNNLIDIDANDFLYFPTTVPENTDLK